MAASESCYFYHIPKASGSTTWQLLQWYYPRERICQGRMWEDIITLPKESFAHYHAFRGHFLAYLEPFLGRKLDTFTILRDPVERTISHYYHARRAREHPYHADALSMPLAEFCVHPRTRHMVQDYQCGYLACPGGRSPEKVAEGMTQEDFAVYKLQLALDPRPDEFPPPDDLYRIAHDRLQSFVAVGITERLQESLLSIARALGLPDPPAFKMRNVGSNRPDKIDDETIKVIREHTQVDQALYDAVKPKVEERLDSLRETQLP